MKHFAEPFILETIAEIRAYRDGFTKRIPPAFAGIEDEVEYIACEEMRRLEINLDPNHYDIDDLIEMASESAQRRYETLADTRQGVVNLFVAGLYHLLAQQFDCMVKILLPSPSFQDDDEKRQFEADDTMTKFVKVIDQQGINIKSAKQWERIQELKLIANTVKHGSGSSAAKLYEKRPELFSPSVGEALTEKDVRQMVLKPIMGGGVYLSDDEIVRYSGAIEDFLRELSVELERVLCRPA
jgi:hypothetical protein